MRPPVLRRVVIVNFVHDDKTAIRGVLWTTHGSWLVVKKAELLAGGAVTPLDGDVVIARETVAFLQAL